MKRVRVWAARVAIAGLLAVSAAVAFVCLVPFPSALLERDRVVGPRVYDRSGALLRECLSSDGTRGRWVPLADISPWLVRATIVAEDRRFHEHWGVDARAVARAARDNMWAGRRVSGASTLTMQLVRLLRPRARSWWAKLDEAQLALRLERKLSKDEILEEYFNRAPYGGNVVGAEAAAWRTLGKRARDLSPAEAALLAGLPQGPSRLDPLRCAERARKRQRWILDEMRRLGELDEETYRRALDESIEVGSRAVPCEAPEFVDWLGPLEGDLRTTLDLPLQRAVEGIVHNARTQLQAAGAREAAVVVLDNASGEVQAFVGPAARRRSPGSTLKPLLYALALEGGRTPASLYDDSPVHLSSAAGVYSPRNYDGEFHGVVTLRQALANSLNVPAVLALRDVGMARFVELLRAAGLEGVDPDPRKHGLGLILGDARVSPVELAGAYAMFARGGLFIRPHGTRATRSASVLSPAAAYLVADILADDDARALSFGTETELSFDFRAAAKTGTSGDHRDNWVAGFTGASTVVVWVGNPDGRPLRGTSGLEGAGPIFHQVMLRLGGKWLDRPDSVAEAEVCPDSGLLPAATCPRAGRELFSSVTLPRERCSRPAMRFTLKSPAAGGVYTLDPTASAESGFLTFEAKAPSGATVDWYLDGELLRTTRSDHRIEWRTIGGEHELRARCAGEEHARHFRVR